MPSRKSKSPNPRNGSLRHKTSTSSSLNSSVNTSANDMNGGQFLERRKNAHLEPLQYDNDEDSSDARDRLMGRSTFSLDEAPPEKEGGEGESKGFFELPMQDRRNFLLLVLLYFLQGIPMGLAGGSIPFLLKSHLSYSQIGVYSLASYPYSLKLLWSPIVDAIWSARVGRRKSWILPIQTLSGFGMLYLGSRASQMMEAAGADGGAGVWNFTGWWFSLVFMCATQDIAVDGWALTLLSQSNLSYASTAQTVGLTGGQFLSYTVFLALNSPDFANKWFRSQPLDVGLITLNSYLTFFGWFYLLVTLGLAVLKKEDRTKENESVWGVYKTMGGIMKLKNIQTFIIIHLIAKIGFQANDAVTNLKLIDKGFSQEDLALVVLIDFPFEMGLGYYAGKWSEQYQPVRVWCWAFVGRLVAAVFAQLVVMFFPVGGTTTSYLFIIIIEHVFSTFMSTVMFVAISAFHAKISDPAIGGTYMTLLATVSNLGGTFPRFFILKAVDAFTQATCIPPKGNPGDLKGDLITQSFDCVAEAEKHRCVNGGGTCNIGRDGYYYVNVLCVIFGVITFWGYIKPAALKLQALPMRAWRLAN
ncbi:Putative ampG-like permease/Acetyl-coenzyme A transporter 1, MFS transporter superfamily [Septoria linicola]|uniref:AmpG-like permease/Acetyl-coenzyme A transporter 1, MFS transporter superfamily n=1 Tax=Septoria linicola TaxID=215465 RepID=A0A9Q9ALX4_9PEZI|nr:putative ampG-like permease/Acetyl-coenzyme A transporter 1, MFS transporter superfamily [Septoria linicola]USW50484.1 Putative ampG-like permease/Acetyl-coenzyme A transporter 1, MFS transporter superfamily [Septoria linicola]